MGKWIKDRNGRRTRFWEVVLIAILLMMDHAIGASLVLIRKDEQLVHNFHKPSLLVWFILLIPTLILMIFFTP
jgi:uncharacterized membrane protein YhaH (DUF805 family)